MELRHEPFNSSTKAGTNFHKSRQKVLYGRFHFSTAAFPCETLRERLLPEQDLKIAENWPGTTIPAQKQLTLQIYDQMFDIAQRILRVTGPPASQNVDTSREPAC